MDSLLTPLPGKANNSKPKFIQKTNQAAKIGTGESQNYGFKQNRVFGTLRSTNIIQGKPAWDTSITKTKIGLPHRQPKSIGTNQVDTKPHDKKSIENANSGMNKKSDTLALAEKTSNNVSQEKGNDSEPKTPATSSHVGSKSSTPFYSALHCSKCRFDKLETSSYWVAQIKMAESVGKHFVACDFFRLALACQAQPMRNLRIELRRYLLRHGYLLEQKEWGEVDARYGLLKSESNTTGMDSSTHHSKNESDTKLCNKKVTLH